MPLGNKPTCELCKSTNSTMWRKGNNGDVICNTCFLKQSCPGGEKDGNDSNGSIPERTKSNGSNSLAGPVLRKSARIKPAKHKYITAAKALATKGKSRRMVFKKSVNILYIFPYFFLTTVCFLECVLKKWQLQNSIGIPLFDGKNKMIATAWFF